MKKPEITIGKTTIGEIIDIPGDCFGQDRALEYNALDIKLNFSQFREVCDQAAKGLMALGVEKNEHIAIWANNLPEWVYTRYGGAKAGLRSNTCHPNISLTEAQRHRDTEITKISKYSSEFNIQNSKFNIQKFVMY